LKSFISIIIGSIIIFALGVFYLGSIIGYNKALQAGLLPFIPSELFKIALAVLLIPTLKKILK
jgi:biotin transport system substrate-specific component